MSDDFARLGIAVDSTDARSAKRDLDGLTSSAKKTEQQTEKLTPSFRRASSSLASTNGQARTAGSRFDGLSRSQDRAARSSDGLSSSVKRLGTAVAAYLSVREIIGYAEAWTTLENRLKTVTDTQAGLNFALDATFNIAQRSRAPLKSTAELYQRIQSNADALKLSGGEVAGVVETITKSLTISGASAAAADAALVQLGQAFASGTLRGDELNSVLEQAPALAGALADGLGVTVGKLRELGQEGKLTADAVVAALQRQAGQIDSTFADLEPTIGQSISLINNSLTRFVGEMNDATGGSAILARSIQNLSQYIDDGALLDGVVRQMEIWKQLVEGTSGGIAGLKNEMQLLGDIGGDSVDFILTAFQEMPVNIKAMIQTLTTEVAYGFDYIGLLSEEFAEKVKAVFGDETFDQVEARYKMAFDGIGEARSGSLDAIYKEREETLANADSAVESIRREREERQQAYEERLQQGRALAEQKGGGSILGSGPSDKELEKGLERVRQQLYTEEEEIAASFVRRQETLADYLAANGDFETEYRELTLANVQDFNNDMLALDKKRADEQVRITDKAEREKAAAERKSQRERLQLQATFANIASNIIYAAFGESKDARRAQALISTYQAANDAMADTPGPSWVRLAAASAITLAGLKTVSMIDNTNIGSGGGGSGSYSAGSIGQTSFNTPVISQQPPVQEQQQPIQVIFNGDLNGVDSDTFTDMLAAKIIELKDRDYITLSAS